MKKISAELIKDARELAEKYYSQGKYLCSEAVLSAVNEVLDCGMPQEYVRLASGFPVGMGGSGCSCGAVTGGQCAIGLVNGRSKPGGNNKKVMKLSKQLHDRFKEKYKSVCCRVLIKDYKFGSKGHIERCTKVTGETCQMVMEILMENQGILSKISFLTDKDR
ncbi:C-GCAxxG-C-C family protein [Paramaledivibacter caminithermalis]|uniref:C_GCAxxG_C_C family probable redox protein n=1 Tax=Paramaledivibacter caminithermalis (strain DSM 15212 / CIP 107654 / DViRD3) TaxID=1121301 RepID=A0A1M6LWC3_PARC5|nr:C-GCAxxG-C-C family protein [Paramaledivibacter caminithermalis]SHJ75524.1 C_GCAxxG_C_C family probable redox protein [Paramaledivibacter caminithermalis DSM 15212]